MTNMRNYWRVSKLCDKKTHGKKSKILSSTCALLNCSSWAAPLVTVVHPVIARLVEEFGENLIQVRVVFVEELLVLFPVTEAHLDQLLHWSRLCTLRLPLLFFWFPFLSFRFPRRLYRFELLLFLRCSILQNTKSISWAILCINFYEVTIL